MRWLTPVGVLAVILLAGFIQPIHAVAVPDLAPLTAKQLIVKAQQTKVQTFTGTLQLDANLGIPSLSSLQAAAPTGGGFNPADLLSGSHRATIAVDGPDKQRLKMTSSLSEFDVFHNGQDLWTWQSDGSQVTHTVLHDHETGAKPDTTATGPTHATAPASNPMPVPTPDDLAQKLLDHITPSTAVSVATPSQIAGHNAYELVLAPHAAASTIDHVAMAIDAVTGFPLRVSVFGKGDTKPALQLGFTSLSYARPSGSFTFTPPPGSHLSNSLVAGPRTGRRRLRMRRMANGKAAPNFAPGPVPQKALRGIGPAGPAPGATAAVHPTVVGQDWTQVVIGARPALGAIGFELMKAATPVHGAFGSGRLLHTDLVSVLFLDDGQVAAGFVTPSALEAAIPHP